MKALLHYLFVALFMFTKATAAYAQVDDWEELLQELVEDQPEEEEEVAELAGLMEELLELHENPLNINKVTREDLSSLPFLTEKQAEAIVNFRARYGGLRSMGELKMIPELDLHELRWLRQVAYVGEMPQHEWKQTYRPVPQHDFMTRWDIPAYRREGWSWGRGIGHRIRYGLQWGQHWDVGIRAEKDAGEPMFTNQNPLWDAWGGHVMVKGVRLGGCMTLKSALVGDFKATFGEGVVMNTGFRFGKQQGNLWRSATSVRPHRSTEESRYLRGVAATVGLCKDWTLTALYSIRSLDATVQKDNTVRAVNTAGLHRTETELSHRNTLGSQTSALHLDWHHGPWAAGVTGLFQYYDHQFSQGDALYRQIYPEGYLFGAASVNYALRLSHWALCGETAYSLNRRGGGFATLNKGTWRYSTDLQFSVIHRFYSKDYFSPHASAFGENTMVQNESGLCLMMDASRIGPLSLRALFDYFYSPWPRFTMSRYSTGFQGMVNATWQFSRQHSLLLRYSVKSKERSDCRHYSHHLRGVYTRKFSPQWQASASAFLHHYVEPKEAVRSTGVALMPRVDWHLPKSGLWASLALAWFATEDFNSRLYFYEPSLMQTFGMQMLYGKGERLAATLRWRVKDDAQTRRRLEIQFKAGITHYRDRDEISQGPTLIRSAWKPDFQLLLHYKLR